MKTGLLFAAIGLTVFSSHAEPPALETFCPHFPTNAPIVWQAPIQDLPKTFWIYRRLPTQPFPATLISNAICLAGLQNKGIPQPTTNDFFIWEERPANYPGMIPDLFEMLPKSGTFNYAAPHPEVLASNIPPDEILIKRARDYAFRLGIDPAQIVLQRPRTSFTTDDHGFPLTNQIIGRSFYFARQLDGVVFLDPEETGGSDGFWIQFGSRGSMRSFSYVWPALKRHEEQPAASPEQIIACIRAFKTMLSPANDGDQYFERIKSFAQAKKFTITKITPFYDEGVYGEVPTNDAQAEFIIPQAMLDGEAEFAGSNMAVRLYSPIVGSEAGRRLKKTEPSYQGRKLGEWLRDFDAADHPERGALAAEALRHIGAVAVPFLVEQLSAAKASQTEKDLKQWRKERDQAPEGVKIPRPPMPREEALAGIDALGAVAESALPALEQLLHEDPPDPRAVYVAARIGPASFPLLRRCLTNEVATESKIIRLEAKVCLEMLNTRGELLYPKIPVGPDAPSFQRRISEFNLKMLSEAFKVYRAEHPEEYQGDLFAPPPARLPG